MHGQWRVISSKPTKKFTAFIGLSSDSPQSNNSRQMSYGKPTFYGDLD